MDPQATLQLIIEALQEGDFGTAFGGLSNLADWLRHGGFAPRVQPRTWISISRGGEFCYSILSYPDRARFIGYRLDKRMCVYVQFEEYNCPIAS